VHQDLQLGYLVLEVSDLDAWSEFTTRTLGMSVDGASSEDALRVRMDELQQRFLVRSAGGGPPPTTSSPSG
jgi:biphenyl-2,3-diol 1,2-dioxygenase